MARSISLIQAQILDSVRADPTLNPLLTSTSKRAIYRLWAFIVAVAINILEQLIDIFTAYIEKVAASAAANNAAWLQDQILKFQYSATNPQIIQLINFAPSYPIVDETLRIVTRCSITTDLANNVLIKVAKGDPPEALTVDEVSALQSMVDITAVPGITYVVKSTDADEIYIEAEIFYLGQYGAAIVDLVITAINNFLATASSASNFNGKIKVSDLEAAIRNVSGVTDVLLKNVFVRAASTPFADGTALVLNNQVVSRLWNTVSGYIIGESSTGKTFSDTLQFIPE